MALKYYFDLMSQPCRSLYIFLKLNKIPYEAHQVALRKGEHFGEDFEKLNPMKKVPLITHGAFRLTESVAIIRYLAREFKTADHWYPADSKEQAKVDEFLEWQHLNLRAHGSMLFMHRVLIPQLKQREPDQKKIEHFRSELDKTLDNMHKMFLTNTPFINRDQISVADIFAACEIEQPITAGYNVLENKPEIREWMGRVQNQLEPHYTEAHKINEKLKTKLDQLFSAKL